MCVPRPHRRPLRLSAAYSDADGLCGGARPPTGTPTPAEDAPNAATRRLRVQRGARGQAAARARRGPCGGGCTCFTGGGGLSCSRPTQPHVHLQPKGYLPPQRPTTSLTFSPCLYLAVSPARDWVVCCATLHLRCWQSEGVTPGQLALKHRFADMLALLAPGCSLPAAPTGPSPTGDGAATRRRLAASQLTLQTVASEGVAPTHRASSGSTGGASGVNGGGRVGTREPFARCACSGCPRGHAWRFRRTCRPHGAYAVVHRPCASVAGACNPRAWRGSRPVHHRVVRYLPRRHGRHPVCDAAAMARGCAQPHGALVTAHPRCPCSHDVTRSTCAGVFTGPLQLHRSARRFLDAGVTVPFTCAGAGMTGVMVR
jgi:hypothetical protein